MCTWPAATRSLKAGGTLQSNEGIIQENRRQKKRCSYGVRTVELERSKSGYGFTISGQYPCILSCIVSQSPAEKAGLRPGDYLIAVNNKNVSKSFHDDVVRLIGNSLGVLKLQIADSYYSDSSEDELVTVVRPKLKYPNRTKHVQTQVRAEKVVEDLHAGLLFKQSENKVNQHDYKNITDAQLLMHHSFNGNKNNVNGKENCLLEREVNSLLHTSFRQMQSNYEKCDDDAIYRAIVGYLGTIEMPKDLQIPRLQAIRNCIRRLRVEKKVHILVLLSVYQDKVTLVNSRGMKVAEYPSEKITYSGIYANDKKFFGLVTSNERRTRSSCHVFIVESKMKLHSNHLQGARTFNMKYNLNLDQLHCEFPETAEPILCAISSLYRNRSNGGSFGLIDVTLTNRSHTSSNSSNSDSGIGFKDDFHHQKDSVFVVHDNRSAHLNRMNNQSPATVTLNATENRLTVRAMPNPIALSGRNSCSFERNSFHKYAPNKNENLNKFRPSLIRPVIAITPKRIPTNLEEYKLSPKVYGIKYPNETKGKDIFAGTKPENYYDSTTSQNGLDEYKLKDGSQEVNPSEGCPETSESDAEDEVYSEVDNKWIRISSLQACKQVSPHSTEVDGVSSSEEFVADKLPHNSMMGLDINNVKSVNNERSRVASWSLSFDKLLEDPAGIHTFAIFLKREFSYENIHFWVACERYKIFAVTDELMTVKAKEIFQRHLCIGASEPVNVDSQAQQIAEENLDRPNRDIFVPAQKQIYNLMKFDCYLRFLKSQIYKDTLLKEISDEPLIDIGDDDLDPGLPYNENNGTTKEQQDNLLFEEKRRKSLLSWNRTKKTENGVPRKSVRKKRKDKKDDASDTHGSRSSLANGDLTTMQKYTSSRESLSGMETNFSDDGYSLCRVLLPDDSTAVVQTKSNESIINILRNLLERRNLVFTIVDVFLIDSNKAIDVYEDSRVLSSLEIRIEERILFHMTLPNKKTLIVKSCCEKIIRDVLRSVLNRNGFKMESVVIINHNNGDIDLQLPARNYNKQSLIIDFKEKQLEWGTNAAVRRKSEDTDSITKLFNDIVSEKLIPQWDDYGVWDLDKISKIEAKSTLERKSAGILGVARRNSLNFERDIKKLKNKNRSSIHESVNHRIVQQPTTEKPPIHKTYKKEENDDLYHVWERAQRSRLDDQRGTEINFEMPDFLKPQPKKFPLEHSTSETLIQTKYYEQKTDSVVIEDFSGTSIIPTVEQAEEFFSAKSAGYIRLSSKDEQKPNISTRKSHSLITKSKSSHQITTTNNIPTTNSEKTHKSYPSHDAFKLIHPPKATVKSHDDSISPSKIAPPNVSDTSLHLEEANFTPPPRLQLPTPPNTPPPLPPKPKYYPPRLNFGIKNLANVSQDLNNKRIQTSNKAITDQDVRSRRAMYIEREMGDKFSISFV